MKRQVTASSSLVCLRVRFARKDHVSHCWKGCTFTPVPEIRTHQALMDTPAAQPWCRETKSHFLPTLILCQNGRPSSIPWPSLFHPARSGRYPSQSCTLVPRYHRILPSKRSSHQRCGAGKVPIMQWSDL